MESTAEDAVLFNLENFEEKSFIRKCNKSWSVLVVNNKTVEWIFQ